MNRLRNAAVPGSLMYALPLEWCALFGRCRSMRTLRGTRDLCCAGAPRRNAACDPRQARPPGRRVASRLPQEVADGPEEDGGRREPEAPAGERGAVRGEAAERAGGDHGRVEAARR